MGLGAFDIVSSFLTGVQERSAEIDKDNRDLADRFKTLSEGKDDTNLKTKFAKEVDNYNEDKKLLKAVKSAYASNDWATAQQLLGGFDSLDAYWKARDINPDIYYKLPKLGEEPIFTKADYGVTNGTTIGRIVESFVNPEAEEKRKESETPTAATYTKYGRETDEEGNIVYARSEEEITNTKDALIELQKAYRHKSKPAELTTIIPDPDTPGHWIKLTLTKNASYDETGNTPMDLAAAAIRDNYEIFKGYSVSEEARYTQAGHIDEGTELTFVRQGILVDKNDKILENQDQAIRMQHGENIDGHRIAAQNVIAHRTNKDEDTIEMNGKTLTGWIYKEEKIIPLDKVAKKDKLTVLQQNKDKDGNDLLGKTEFTLHLTEDGSTGDIAKKLGLNEDDTYTYAGYYVTRQDNKYKVEIDKTQDWVEQQWVFNGRIIKSPYSDGKRIEGAEYLDIKFKAKFTGEDEHSVTHFKHHKDAYTEKGWQLIGRDIVEATDTTTTTGTKDLDATGKWLIADFELRPEMWKEVMANLNYKDDVMTPHIAESIARTIKELKLNLYDGTLIDTLNSLTDITKVSDIPEKLDWTTISLGDTQQYTYDYLRGDSSRTVPYEGPTGAVSQLKIFDNLVKESADDYESFINSYAREFSNTYHVGIVPAVNLMERIAGLALKERDKGFLGFKRLSSDELLFDSGTVLYTENNRDFTVENVVMEIEQFRADYLETVKDKNYSWGQIATYVIRKVKEKQAGNN